MDARYTHEGCRCEDPFCAGCDDCMAVSSRKAMSSRYFWYCNVCEAQNSREDGECQYCDCEGAECKRDNCSGENCRNADYT